MTSVEKSVECFAAKIEALAESLPQCRFVHHKSHMTLPGMIYRNVKSV
jgi:hypothetical protein